MPYLQYFTYNALLTILYLQYFIFLVTCEKRVSVNKENYLFHILLFNFKTFNEGN